MIKKNSNNLYIINITFDLAISFNGTVTKRNFIHILNKQNNNNDTNRFKFMLVYAIPKHQK